MRRRDADACCMNLALLDFDGTITERDTFSSVLRFAVRGRYRNGDGSSRP
jgi:hypothetical protein